MTGKEQLLKEGMDLIKGTMTKYRLMIEHAPSRNAYNKFTGKFDDSKNNVRRAKVDAIKDIVQDFALLGVELLSASDIRALDE